jgi:hypothetical protein
MSASHTPINVDVVLGAAPVAPAGFGIPLLLGFDTGGSFTERVRSYTSAADADADADLSATQKADIAAAFIAAPALPLLKVGRCSDVRRAVRRVTVSNPGAGGDTVSVTITTQEDVYGPFVATTPGAGSPTNLTVVDALLLLIAANAELAAQITLTDGGASFDVTCLDESDTDFAISVADSGTAEIATSSVTTAVPLSTALAAIVAEDPAFYYVVLQSGDQNTEPRVKQLALWTEANKRFCFVQSDEAAILTTSTTDLLSVLQDLERQRCCALYHADNDEAAALALACSYASTEYEAAATTVAFTQLPGLTAQALTTTELGRVKSKGGNALANIEGLDDTAVVLPGKTSSGAWADLVVLTDWLRIEIMAALAAIPVAARARGAKIPYGDDGFSVMSAAIAEVLDRGVRAGHLTEGSTVVAYTPWALLSDGDKTARRSRYTFSARGAGALQDATVSGVVTSV